MILQKKNKRFIENSRNKTAGTGHKISEYWAYIHTLFRLAQPTCVISHLSKNSGLPSFTSKLT